MLFNSAFVNALRTFVFRTKGQKKIAVLISLFQPIMGNNSTRSYRQLAMLLLRIAKKVLIRDLF